MKQANMRVLHWKALFMLCCLMTSASRWFEPCGGKPVRGSDTRSPNKMNRQHRGIASLKFHFHSSSPGSRVHSEWSGIKQKPVQCKKRTRFRGRIFQKPVAIG
jgi:hypothetical protein